MNQIRKITIIFFLLFSVCTLLVLTVSVLLPKEALSYQTLSYAQLPIYNGPGTSNKLQAKLINSESELNQLISSFAMYSPIDQISAVDFRRQSLIVLYGAKKASGGNSLRITSVNKTFYKIYLEAVMTTPGNDCITTSFFNSPVVAVAIPKTSGSVDFHVKEEKKDCTKGKQNLIPLPL